MAPLPEPAPHAVEDPGGDRFLQVSAPVAGRGIASAGSGRRSSKSLRLATYRIHTSLIRNAFHGVARRAGTKTTPRCEGRGAGNRMPWSGAFVCSDFVRLRVLRGESSVTTKNCKLHESIRFPPFGCRLESRLRTWI